MAAESIGPAIGRIPSGCGIVTAKAGDLRTGMLASWIQQAAFEPPMISIAIRGGRPIEGIIDRSGQFLLNLLSEPPGSMFKQFGKGFSLDEDAFAGLSVQEHDSGIIIPDRVAWLACRVSAKHPAGDHFMYLGQVVDADVTNDARPYVHLRKTGHSY